MKQLVALAFIFQIASLCHADATLTYASAGGDSGSSLTYYIKDGMLRLSEQGSDRVNLYDQAKQIFVSINNQDETISRIDKDILKQRAEQLDRQRLQRLAQAEKQLNAQLDSMGPEEQEIAASLVNKLKYPEFYGAHTFIEVTPTDSGKTVADYACKVYRVTLQDRLIKQLCMADFETLGLSESDYRTLRDFYHFNYQVRTRMMLAAGKTDFTLIDYEQENMPGLPLEIIDYQGQPGPEPDASLRIRDVSTKLLDRSLFEGQLTKK